MSNQEPRDLEVADLDSGSNDAVSFPDHDEKYTSPSEQQSETEGWAVLPSTTGLRLSEDVANIPQVDVEMDEALTVSQPQKDLNGENLDKILTLSNQVS